MLKHLIHTCFLLCLFSFTAQAQDEDFFIVDKDLLEIARKYVVYQTDNAFNINGIPDESDWDMVSFTEEFIDIEGEIVPQYSTRVKMLWDKRYLYVYAEMEEPHIWAKLKDHDAVIYQDNDFEVFIDPDNDGRNYSEIEINALNTTWDLILDKPYRLGGTANDYFELVELESAVYIDGTLNNPEDIDNYWAVEMAIPLEAVLLAKHRQKKFPSDKDIWRVNFSRVEWQFDIVDGKYIRKKKNGKLLPEMNWVWSPMGEINMHIPELWGYIQFTTNRADREIIYEEDDIELTRQVSFELFRRFKFGDLVHFTDRKDQFTKNLPPFTIRDQDFSAIYYKTPHGFTVVLTNESLNKSYSIDETGSLQEMRP